MKNINLSASEYGIFRFLRKKAGSAVTHQEIAGIFPEQDSIRLNKTTSSLLRKGFLYPLKRGVYLINEEPSKKPEIRDPLSIATSIYKGYLGFSSALRLYDLIDYEPFTVFVVTFNKSADLKVGEYIFRYTAMHEKATGETLYKGYYVSTRAKTFFDCFMRPQYAGGYATIANALYLDEKIEWNEFRRYLERFASNSLMQRTGYILDLLRNETNKKIPLKLIDFLRSNVKNKTRLIPDSRIPGKYITEWMLTDNEGKEKILSGWMN